MMHCITNAILSHPGEAHVALYLVPAYAGRANDTIITAVAVVTIIFLAIYQLVVDIFKFPRFFFPGLLMALA